MSEGDRIYVSNAVDDYCQRIASFWIGGDGREKEIKAPGGGGMNGKRWAKALRTFHE